MNLVINGTEAIGDRAGTVLVRTGVRDLTPEFVKENFPGDQVEPGLHVCMEVTDTGSGMDEGTKARIFDPFFTTKFTGRGLGLAAAQGIVHSHKGGMRVYSAPGRGSTFEVFFPVVEPHRPGDGTAGGLEELYGSGTILFVDDEEVLRSLARSALEHYGYQVLLAADGKSGVELYRENRDLIALVVLDMTMPVMAGEDALDRLKAIGPDVPVLLSSGYDESEASRRFAGKDLAGFIQKPYAAETLLQTIARILKPRRA